MTTELQNAKIAFETRTTSISSGTATIANTTGTTLIDVAATFISDGVEPRTTLINFTDRSVATVISVDSETQISHYALDDE